MVCGVCGDEPAISLVFFLRPRGGTDEWAGVRVHACQSELPARTIRHSSFSPHFSFRPQKLERAAVP